MNFNIRAPEVRVIADDGEMLGIFKVPDAVRLANEKGLDLIEIAPQAKPPTCKIMDYGKYKYENKKKASEARKKQVIVSVKEIQIRPRTEDHDLNTKMKHARKFLMGGDKVKINLKFSGREMAHQQMGFDLVRKVAKDLGDVSNIELDPKKEGRHVFAIVVPDPSKIKDYEKAQKLKAEPQPPVENVEPVSQTKEEPSVESETQAEDKKPKEEAGE